MTNQYLEIEVNYNDQWVKGIVEIKDYAKAIRSLKYTDFRKWRSVKVLSSNFKDTLFKNFPIEKIRIVSGANLT